MQLDRALLAFIGRRFPAIFDVIPRGPQSRLGPGASVSLNPQPIPPGAGDYVSLNPQPLPPRELGAQVAADLLHLSWVAARLRIDVAPIADWEEDPCPTWPKVPHLPPHRGPIPDPDPGPDWLRDYHLGLASTLADASDRVGSAPLVEEALSRSAEALAAGLQER
ncbi:hypothetical protein [Pedococcus bigeumensis]|uniref:hypothetical protein n=1 Tax=Pedococcus bigeumensis TaxID=433644 RepID=UPI002FEAC773